MEQTGIEIAATSQQLGFFVSIAPECDKRTDWVTVGSPFTTFEEADKAARELATKDGHKYINMR